MSAIIRFFRSVEAAEGTGLSDNFTTALQTYLDTARHGTGTVTVLVDPVPVGPPAATITIRGRVYTAGAAEDLAAGVFLAVGGGDVNVIRNSIIDVINADALGAVRASNWTTDGTAGRVVLQDITSNLANVATVLANQGVTLGATGMANGLLGAINGSIYTNVVRNGGRLVNIAAVIHDIEEPSAANTTLVTGGITVVSFEGSSTGELNTDALAAVTGPGFPGANSRVDVSALNFAMASYVGIDNRLRTACLVVRNPGAVAAVGAGGPLVVFSARSIGAIADAAGTINAYLDFNNITYINDIELHVSLRDDGRTEYIATITHDGELGAAAAP